MSLRTRFLALFAALAVVPLIAVGVFDYIHSMSALETLVADQVEPIVSRAMRELHDRYDARESDLLLLAENVETQRLYRAYIAGDDEEVAEARAAAEPFMREAWDVLRWSIAWVEFRDTADAVLYRLPDDLASDQAAFNAGGRPVRPSLIEVIRPIRTNERQVGTLRAAIILDRLLPAEALETRLGRAGYSVVLDRARGSVVYHPQHSYRNQPLNVLTGPNGWNVDPSILEQPNGRVVYREAESTHVAVFASMETPPWTIVASGAASEFADPFTRMRFVNLLLVLAVALLVTVAFTVFSRRETRSLSALAAAAEKVGAGDFEPDLPHGSRGEVGKLTAAFRLMADKVGTMIQQVESSRHMAAIGEFSAQVSHEIRNPLTSLKLNLQSLERDVQSGHIPPDCARPVEICLREIRRLDEVATGVLSLGRSRTLARELCGIHALLDESIDVVAAQLKAHDVTVERDFAADSDVVSGETEGLKAAFLNVLLNGAEAMRNGGKLCVSTRTPLTRDTIEVRIADDGPGVPSEIRNQVFRPFFSTKSGGTGLGLPLALRTLEEHGGKLTLATKPPSSRGTEFVIELPLSSRGTES